MKRYYFYTVFVALTFMIFNLTGCITSHLVRGGLNLQSGDYEKAVSSCEAALQSNNKAKPLFLELWGEKVNADYLSSFCLGVSYMWMQEYTMSEKYLLNCVNLYPHAAYISYEALAQLKYKQGKLEEAYRYSLEATKTIGTPQYYNMQPHLKMPPDLYKNIVEAARDFYKMRMLYKELNTHMTMKDYQEAIKIANQILNIDYKVHIGVECDSPKIQFMHDGGIADLNGLMKGDIVLEVDGVKIENAEDLWRESDKIITKYGNTTKFKIERNGRILDIDAKMEYPEIGQTKLILQEAKLNLAGKLKNKHEQGENGPWLKILEPKAARGVKIIGNQTASFVILASGKNAIRSVTVNDVKCTVSDEVSMLEKTILPGDVKKYTVDLPLGQESNRFVVKAYDVRGKNVRQQIEIQGNETYAKKAGAAYNRKVAVVVGINKYHSSDYDTLDYAVKDAQAVKEHLHKMNFDKVIEIPESHATRAGIMRILADELPYTLGKDDALFVYFAGHGDTEVLKNGDMEGYILPRDARKSNYRGTAISMEKIRDVIKRYKAKHILLVFDSCYSGYGAIPKTVSRASHPHDAVQIITAGGKNETAAEDVRVGHGVFTKTFLESFDNKSLHNGDGIILASDIGHYVKKEVSKRTDGKQNPQSRYIEGEGDFRFEYYD